MHRKGRTAVDVYRAEASACLTDDRDIVDDCYPNAFVHKAYRRFDMADPYANVRLDPNFSKLLFRDRAVGRMSGSKRIKNLSLKSVAVSFSKAANGSADGTSATSLHGRTGTLSIKG